MIRAGIVKDALERRIGTEEAERGFTGPGRPFSVYWPGMERESGALTSGQGRALLFALMVPLSMSILADSMLNVALPSLRDAFGLTADRTAWLVTGYTLGYIIFMPLYGRMIGSVRDGVLFLAGTSIFLVGTAMLFTSPSYGGILTSRFVQGAGASAINPLCLAVISSRFPPETRGKAMGIWNTGGPISGILGPFVAGFLVDRFGWRSLAVPIAVVGVLALLVIRAVFTGQRGPFPSGDEAGTCARSSVLRVPMRTRISGIVRFDWAGVLLFSFAVSLLVFFVSSRPLTGRAPLTDWRLGMGSLFAGVFFVLRERRHRNPFVSLDLFRNGTFTRSSLVAGIRMFGLNGTALLAPLTLADVYGLPASEIGFALMLLSSGLLLGMPVGGRLSDRLGSRTPVSMGVALQSTSLLWLGLLPGGSGIGWFVTGLVMHGVGAGLMLAPLHLGAIAGFSREGTGAAAGVYSMLRFTGNLFGSALTGVLLQFRLEDTADTASAYRGVFLVLAGIAFTGIMPALGLSVPDFLNPVFPIPILNSLFPHTTAPARMRRGNRIQPAGTPRAAKSRVSSSSEWETAM